MKDFSIRFWGVRGSIGCSGKETQRYGGNTSCVEARCGEHRLIFDGGTGIRYLGRSLMDQNALDVDIFLSHAHSDHVCGLPFFAPFFDKNAHIRLWGDLSCSQTTVKGMLEAMMRPPFCPITPKFFRARVEYHDFRCGALLEPGADIRISTAQLNHPNGATGFRLEYGGKSVCYVTDTEHCEGKPDDNILALIRNCDVFIYDATYTEEEYPNFRNFGHSTWEEGLRLSEAAGVGHYVIFHHDPTHDDDFMDKVAQSAKARRPDGVTVAREGLVLTLND